MNVESEWKLTFDPSGVPRVLLDYGWEIAEEPSWPLKKGLKVTPLAESSSPFLRLTGNNLVQLNLTIYKDETLDTTARRRVMEELVAWDALGKKPLRVQIRGLTTYWQFAECAVSDIVPARFMDAELARVKRYYAITAKGITQVGA